ncbi:hypothetical protein [Clostridium perfringens]|uniref:Predicted membrane protein n=3 Tax=Clostridium perfringens TaxID=1502 RepID=A0A2X2VCX3_CLOPF|nr:hypothetical protein [Clostridium perfringens]MDY2640165.1 hypothetical protein [Ligilactobacillus salivarius]ABG85518.1 conserved hypothetical protein [Clostridium perfringens SM101]AXH51486.1 hypothetical protein C8114_02340 [Clostridium perfringens]EDS80931.1 conserved hypothetical protein [Clostridium perfringens C str. JGS1495]EJT5917196.1 hypothetical protein [Clostridium perfringens]
MTYKSSIILNKEKYNSYFDNTFKNSIVHHIKCLLLGVFTLGLAYPWIICMKYESTCKHTVICGKRLKFIGDPKELIGHWIFWWILIVITFGLYGFVVKTKFQQWTNANTIFDDVQIK